MKLYQLTNGIGTYWVVAEHPTEAQEKLESNLNKADYGFGKDRVTKTITLIAENIEFDSNGNPRFTNRFLIV